MYPCIHSLIESNNKDGQHHTLIIHLIPSHPSTPFDNVISLRQRWIVGHQTRKAVDGAGEEPPKFLPTVSSLSVRLSI